MTLTPYDRRQLQGVLRELFVAQQNVLWALEGNDPALRCAFASRACTAAAYTLNLTDRRITRRSTERASARVIRQPASEPASASPQRSWASS